MKKGFTLVEIIISIGLIVVIGTISIFSFNIIKKNNKEKTLESMSETIFNAVNVYLESNTDVKKQLYNNKNGLKIPLTTLENSGLVDFGDLSDDLDDEDFVVTMLGSTDPNDDTCAKTYTAKSWNITDNETIYICEKSNGTTNLVQVAGPADNLSKATRLPYVFSVTSRNLIQLKWDESKIYKIMYIDTDDSLILYSPEQFTNVFNESQILPVDTDNTGNRQQFTIYTSSPIPNVTSVTEFREIKPGTKKDTNVNGTAITITDAALAQNYSFSASGWNNSFSYTSLIKSRLVDSDSSDSTFGYYYQYTYEYSGYKIRLKTCMKITGGTGSTSTPYMLDNKC